MRAETVQEFGLDYARTLNIWRAHFEESWPQIERRGFDERFRRMWRYYLSYCEAAFSEGLTNVGIYRFTKAAR